MAFSKYISEILKSCKANHQSITAPLFQPFSERLQQGTQMELFRGAICLINTKQNAFISCTKNARIRA